MDVEVEAEGFAIEQDNRRARPRFEVDEGAVLLLVSHGLPLECRVMDLSLGGCRVCTKAQFSAGVQVHVEVTFKINGIAFRFSGITQWTDGRRQVGVRFVDVPIRRREELDEVISEVAAVNVAKAAKLAAEELAAEAEAQAKLAWERQVQQDAEQEARKQAEVPATAVQTWFMQQKAEPEKTRQLPIKPTNRERRVQSRLGVDTSAVIYLIKVGSQLSGRILDLSLGGCHIRMDEEFPVGIYTRIETEFRIEGLPFRLAGVIQVVQDRDRHHVGIRFLDMSDRKRLQLEQLIAEIEEMHGRQTAATAKDSVAGITRGQEL